MFSSAAARPARSPCGCARSWSTSSTVARPTRTTGSKRSCDRRRRRPDLEFAVGHVFAGVDSVALEYRVGDWLHGIEFMTLDESGLVSFAAGNDVLRPSKSCTIRAR